LIHNFVGEMFNRKNRLEFKSNKEKKTCK